MSLASSSHSCVTLTPTAAAARNTHTSPIPTSIEITKSDITDAPSSTDYEDKFFQPNVPEKTDPTTRVEEQKVLAVTTLNKMLAKKQLAAFRDHVYYNLQRDDKLCRYIHLRKLRLVEKS